MAERRRLSNRTSVLEERFAAQLRAAGAPEPVRELVFADGRRWRFDFAWPEYRLAVEIEGGVWTMGRHTRGSGFVSDCDKYNSATALGWHVLRFTDSHINNGSALTMTLALLRETRGGD